MKKLCVIGDPIGHSLSPKIHAAFGEQTGIALEYTAEHVTPEHLEPFLKRFFAEGGSGLNVTVPHKRVGMALVSAFDRADKAAGAVNTLFYNDDVLTGDNTDGAGLVDVASSASRFARSPGVAVGCRWGRERRIGAAG